MKQLFGTIIILVFTAVALQGQIGIRAKYNINKFKESSEDLEPFFQKSNLIPSGYELGLDYWFRLKNRRIEFMPEVYYNFNASSFENGFINDITLHRIGFNFNTHVYPLDFEEDCDCPTFSKQGPSIAKGFFFHVSPGFSYDLMSMDSNAGAVNKNDNFNLKIGGGVGIDIGVNDRLTISPIYTYNYYFGGDWTISNFPNGEEPLVKTNSASTHHQLAIRLGLRFDY